MKNKSFAAILLTTIICLIACRKDKDQTGIPLVSVNITIYTSDPEFFKLNPVGGWEYITGGSRGILVYRAGQDDFKAYDRHCTYQPTNNCGKVAVDNTDIIAVDTCCGSQFLIVDGTVQNGPATLALKEYRTSFDGEKLRIYN